MTSTDQLEQHKNVYRRYIELLNAQDFDTLSEVVDPEKYKEICVGFTPGWVNLTDAVTSLKKVLTGIPNLHARIEDVVAEDNKVYARLKVTGTQKGGLFGMPATHKSYEVQMFDFAMIERGKIVERIQQSDNLGQFITLFKETFITVGVVVAVVIVGLVTALILK